MNMTYFRYDHLPEHLQVISKPLCDIALAYELDSSLNEEEKEEGLRKLLEAKDCMVRAALVGNL